MVTKTLVGQSQSEFNMRPVQGRDDIGVTGDKGVVTAAKAIEFGVVEFPTLPGLSRVRWGMHAASVAKQLEAQARCREHIDKRAALGFELALESARIRQAVMGERKRHGVLCYGLALGP